MDTGLTHKAVERVILYLALGAICLLYSSPVRSGDFWFHLNNGRWIVENRMLPSQDHFTFTSADEASTRKTLILQAYWLSQSLIYLTYKAAGLYGPVAAKAAVFTLAFYVLYLCLRLGGLGAAASAALLPPVAVMLRSFDEPRPHAFSFLLAIWVFYLLSRETGDRRPGRTDYRRLALLPLSMALWSNLHPGYVIGMGVIGIFLGAGTLRFIMRRDRRDAGAYERTALWLIASLLASGLNPNGFAAVRWVFEELGSSPAVRNIDEYMPVLRYALMTSDYALIAGMGALAGLCSLVLFLSWRRLRLEHLVLFLGFGYAAYGSYRFSFFFGLVSVAVAGQYVKAVIPVRAIDWRWSRGFGQALAVLMALWAGGLALYSTSILRGPFSDLNTPVAAARAVRSSALPPELFNPYEWGGQLGWTLYPDYRVFVDARTIDLAAHMDYRRARNGDMSVLDRRGVNTVLFYTLNPVRFGGGPPGVVLELMQDPQWGLVFYDPISAVFVRRSALSRKTLMLGKELLRAQLETRLTGWAQSSPGDHRPHAGLAGLYASYGERDRALAHLERSLALSPGNAEAAWVFNRYGPWPADGLQGDGKSPASGL